MHVLCLTLRAGNMPAAWTCKPAPGWAVVQMNEPVINHYSIVDPPSGPDLSQTNAYCRNISWDGNRSKLSSFYMDYYSVARCGCVRGKQGKAGGGVQIIHMHNITEENVTLRCIQGQFGGLKWIISDKSNSPRIRFCVITPKSWHLFIKTQNIRYRDCTIKLSWVYTLLFAVSVNIHSDFFSPLVRMAGFPTTHSEKSSSGWQESHDRISSSAWWENAPWVRAHITRYSAGFLVFSLWTSFI